MASFAFSSLGQVLLMIGVYVLVAICWAILWHSVSQETDFDGRKRYSSFWRWWIGRDNPSTICVSLNLLVLFFFCYSMFRLICTILYGYCPVE